MNDAGLGTSMHQLANTANREVSPILMRLNQVFECSLHTQGILERVKKRLIEAPEPPTKDPSGVDHPGVDACVGQMTDALIDRLDALNSLALQLERLI